MSNLRTSILVILFLVVPGIMGLEKGYDRIGCLAKVTDMLNNNTSPTLLDPSYFAVGLTLGNPLLTLPGCNALCSPTWGPYPDDGPRLYDWIIPGILLIANLHFAPIGRKRYLHIAHILGDPVDSMWRLLSTIEDWVESHRKAHEFLQGQKKRPDGVVQPEEIAVIISGAARLVPSLDFSNFSKWLFSSLNIEYVSEKELKIRCDALHETAIALRDQRLHDIRRTGFAILVYILQVVVVFLPAVGGSPNPSGGRVSPAMMLVWLLPLVLLSNAIGDYGCWRHSAETLTKFLGVVGVNLDECLTTNKKTDSGALNPFSIPTFGEIACSGAVLHSCASSARRKAILAFLSVLPVALACATAFAVDYTAPTYFSCRATSIMVSFALWLLSAAATGLMRLSVGRHLWLFIWLKDIVVATPILAFILLSTCGFFNSCYCSSGAILRGNRAQVVLNPVASYPLNNGIIYPATVTIGLGLQLLIPILMRFV